MQTPPPIPENTTRPIRRAVFRENKSFRMDGVTFDFSLVEAAHAKAEAWINGNPGIKIVQIETFHDVIHGITVVWYR